MTSRSEGGRPKAELKCGVRTRFPPQRSTLHWDSRRRHVRSIGSVLSRLNTVCLIQLVAEKRQRQEAFSGVRCPYTSLRPCSKPHQPLRGRGTQQGRGRTTGSAFASLYSASRRTTPLPDGKVIGGADLMPVYVQKLDRIALLLQTSTT